MRTLVVSDHVRTHFPKNLWLICKPVFIVCWLNASMPAMTIVYHIHTSKIRVCPNCQSENICETLSRVQSDILRTVQILTKISHLLLLPQFMSVIGILGQVNPRTCVCVLTWSHVLVWSQQAQTSSRIGNFVSSHTHASNTHSFICYLGKNLDKSRLHYVIRKMM